MSIEIKGEFVIKAFKKGKRLSIQILHLETKESEK